MAAWSGGYRKVVDGDRLATAATSRPPKRRGILWANGESNAECFGGRMANKSAKEMGSASSIAREKRMISSVSVSKTKLVFSMT